MKLGIMQPYFFPYLGYFELIGQVDRWIVFDTAQYIRHGWVNRNRILHPTTGWQYLVVPLEKHARDTPIRDIRAHPERRWKRKLLGQLEHYRRRAPYFRATRSILEEALDTTSPYLAEINVLGLELVCRYLELSFDFSWFSRMDLQLGPIEAPGDWALEIASALGATEYLNPPGGAELFDEGAFLRRGIRLTLLEPRAISYAVSPYTFEPNLSILDVMMWNSPSRIRAMLAEGRG
ncbi:MAG: WbqC family protein [Woeseiaceae bacterium]